MVAFALKFLQACDCGQTSLFPLWEAKLRVELIFPRWVRLGVSLGDIPSGQVSSHGTNDVRAPLAEDNIDNVYSCNTLVSYFQNYSTVCHSVTSTSALHVLPPVTGNTLPSGTSDKPLPSESMSKVPLAVI